MAQGRQMTDIGLTLGAVKAESALALPFPVPYICEVCQERWAFTAGAGEEHLRAFHFLPY